ncbi:LamG domain-containing protein [Haloferula sargassicola]|uniref:LamG-like jellyroll fold domain-containing protein n=1 Tax=Haloferula sargassicola TaxID=490096 RepID=A0ABP9UT46_9BACT
MKPTFRARSLTAAALALGLLAEVGNVRAAFPVAHLTFDDALDLGADSSGNGNDGTPFGTPSPAAGISGGAADFTTGNHTFRWTGESNPVENVLEGDFTFSVWVNTTATGGGAGNSLAYLGQAIIYADVSGISADTTPMALNGSNLASLTAGTGMLSTSPINTGQWVHLVVTRDFGGVDRIYVNGAAEGAISSSATQDLSGRNEVVLGGNLIDSRYFNGLIDDFQAYNVALSASQVAWLHRHPGASLPDSAYAGITLSNGVAYSQNFNTMTATTQTFPNGVFAEPVNPPAGWTFEGNGANLGKAGERALGIGTAPDAAFGASFVIETGGEEVALDFAFTAEQWYQVGSGAIGSFIDFEYSTDATSLTTGTWQPFDPFDYRREITLPLGDRATDGDEDDHREEIQGTITLADVPDDSVIWIRWTGVPDASTGGTLRHDGLSVDDFSLTATSSSVPPPTMIEITSLSGGPGSSVLTWETTPPGAAVDLYRSTDLTTWGAPLSTGLASGSFTDNAAPSPRAFYVMVPAGDPGP